MIINGTFTYVTRDTYHKVWPNLVEWPLSTLSHPCFFTTALITNTLIALVDETEESLFMYAHNEDTDTSATDAVSVEALDESQRISSRPHDHERSKSLNGMSCQLLWFVVRVVWWRVNHNCFWYTFLILSYLSSLLSFHSFQNLLVPWTCWGKRYFPSQNIF